MTDKTRDTKPGTGTTAKTPTQATDEAEILKAYGFDRMTDMGTAWLDALNQMGGEVMSFVAGRIREDLKTQHRMLHCKDFSELQDIQSEFIQTAIEQYQAETGKLVEMSRHMMPPGKDDGAD